MINAHEIKSPHSPASGFEALAFSAYGYAEAAIEAFAEYRRKRAKSATARRREREIVNTMRALSRLDDRVLGDIGVRRDDIYSVAVAAVDDPGHHASEYGSR